MQFQDYYKTLAIPRDASQPEIHKAYRGLARRYHPDVNKDAGAEDQFKRIGEAYEVLRDPDKRAKYDRYGQAWKQAQTTGAAPSGWEGVQFEFRPGEGFDSGSSGFSSFFEMLFGQDEPFHWQRQRGSAQRASRPQKIRGRDREASLSVTLEELAQGGSRMVEVFDPTTGGTKSLRVTIPAGLLPGQKIRLSGQGEPGWGDDSGDLLLKIELRDHPQFKLNGRDLRVVLRIAPWEAALGAVVAVPTLDNKTNIRLPPGSSSGQSIRLRTKGLPNPKGPAGDLLAELQIVVPKELTPRENELFTELAQVSPFHPRGNEDPAKP